MLLVAALAVVVVLLKVLPRNLLLAFAFLSLWLPAAAANNFQPLLVVAGWLACGRATNTTGAATATAAAVTPAAAATNEKLANY